VTSDSHIVASNSDIVFPPAARRAQAERNSARLYAKRIAEGFPDRISPELAGFIAGLDTAFLATVSAAGAPYIQHRGGPKGFIKVLDERTLGFADYAGNRQYITISNLAGNDHAYLFLLDFAAQRRIKIWGHARVVENDPALLTRLADPGYRARPERAILFTVEAWDVNCTQHITARFTASEVADATVVLRDCARTPCRANCPKARLRYAHDSLGFRALPFPNSVAAPMFAVEGALVRWI